MGGRQERIGTAYNRLVTNKLRTLLADETHPLRPDFDNRHTDRSDRFRIPRSRTTQYLQSFIPTAIRTQSIDTQTGAIGLGFLVAGQLDTYSRSFQRPFGHTTNKQTDKRNTHRQGMGVRGRRSGGQMEECLGVDVRPVGRVDCNFEEWEYGSIVKCLMYIIRLMAYHLISAKN